MAKKVVVTENADGTFELVLQETVKPAFAKAAPLDGKWSALMSEALAQMYSGEPGQWQLTFHDMYNKRAYFRPDTTLPAWAGVYAAVSYDMQAGILRPAIFRADPPEKADHLDKVHAEWLQAEADTKALYRRQGALWAMYRAKEEATSKAGYEHATRAFISTSPLGSDPKVQARSDVPSAKPPGLKP